jgi:hypothetical protein
MVLIGIRRIRRSGESTPSAFRRRPMTARNIVRLNRLRRMSAGPQLLRKEHTSARAVSTASAAISAEREAASIQLSSASSPCSITKAGRLIVSASFG